MTTLAERIPLDEITAQARQVRFWRTLGAAVLFLLIWTGRLLGYAWMVPVVCFLAVREGWRDVHPPKVKADGGPGSPG